MQKECECHAANIIDYLEYIKAFFNSPLAIPLRETTRLVKSTLQALHIHESAPMYQNLPEFAKTAEKYVSEQNWDVVYDILRLFEIDKLTSPTRERVHNWYALALMNVALSMKNVALATKNKDRLREAENRLCEALSEFESILDYSTNTKILAKVHNNLTLWHMATNNYFEAKTQSSLAAELDPHGGESIIAISNQLAISSLEKDRHTCIELHKQLCKLDSDHGALGSKRYEHLERDPDLKYFRSLAYYRKFRSEIRSPKKSTKGASRIARRAVVCAALLALGSIWFTDTSDGSSIANHNPSSSRLTIASASPNTYRVDEFQLYRDMPRGSDSDSRTSSS